jgi:hypothetical protein
MDDERLGIKQNKKMENCNTKLYTPWERGDCRRCEEISQGEGIRGRSMRGNHPRRRHKKKYYEEIF